jgi:hypothetical protein
MPRLRGEIPSTIGVYGLKTGIQAPCGVCLVSSEAMCRQSERCQIKLGRGLQMGSSPVTASSSGSLNLSFLTL